MQLRSTIRRDRWIVVSCLLGVTALAWFYLASMGSGMAVSGGAGIASWGATDFGLMFLMWAVMMVGMMLPSASPMILMFAKITRSQVEKDLLGPTGAFVFGYIVIWTGFSLAATLSQWGLQSAGLLSPMMASTNSVFAGLVLVAAGVYQWTPLKHACLRHCQTPLGFLMTRWRDGSGGAFRMGLTHGAYCVGCCWALMALLFVGGVMNLLWIALLSVLVLVEKIAPPVSWLPRFVGTGLVAWGGWILMSVR